MSGRAVSHPGGGFVADVAPGAYEVTLSNVLKRVSRKHAEIRWDAGCFWLIDVGSKNATVLNGQRLKAERCYALQHGDRLQIGDYQIDFALV